MHPLTRSYTLVHTHTHRTPTFIRLLLPFLEGLQPLLPLGLRQPVPVYPKRHQPRALQPPPRPAVQRSTAQQGGELSGLEVATPRNQTGTKLHSQSLWFRAILKTEQGLL